MASALRHRSQTDAEPADTVPSVGAKRWLLFSGTAIMAFGILLIMRQTSVTTTQLSLAPSLIVTGIVAACGNT